MRSNLLLPAALILLLTAVWSPRTQASDWRYVYYPEHHLYYAPHHHHWYWQERGHWRHGPVLPASYLGLNLGGIQISLDVDRPYLRHDYVVRHYHRHRPAIHHVYHPPRGAVSYWGGHWTNHGQAYQRWQDDRREWREDRRDWQQDRREWNQDRREWNQDRRHGRHDRREDRRDDRREDRRRDDGRHHPGVR